MRALDDAFLIELGELSSDPESQREALDVVLVSRANPYLDIAAIADLHLDRGDDGTGATAVISDFKERYRQLHRALAGRSSSHLALVAGDLLCERPRDLEAATARYEEMVLGALQQIEPSLPGGLLVVPGNTDSFVGPDGVWPYSQVASMFATRDPAAVVPGVPVVSLVRVDLEGDPEGTPPLGYVVVIGLDSNAQGRGGAKDLDLGLISPGQLRAARRLVTTLRDGVGRTAPLYVIAVTHHGLLPRGAAHDLACEESTVDELTIARSMTGVTANAAAVLAQLQRLRTSLLLHADMQHRAITTLVRTPIEVGIRASDIALVPLAAFDRGAQAAGMVRIRLNLLRGEAEVGYNFDRGPYGEDAGPLQTVTPMQSASRISPAERRLLSRASSVFSGASPAPPSSAPIPTLSDELATTWDRAGYVPLCRQDGSGHGLESVRSLRYYLLLLVREGPAGGYEMLLSRHSPLHPSSVGDWDTLLLPAFKSAQGLLEHLRDDVLRQVVGKAADMHKAKSAQQFESAVGELIGKGESQDEELWQDRMREVAKADLVKLSPTTGIVTKYEYHLVVLLPFVADPGPEETADGDTARTSEQERGRELERTIVSWLDELPRIGRPGDPLIGPTIPIEAIMADGAGLRWEPTADPDDAALEHDPALARELPPGAVWFPLPDSDETHGYWRECPSIVARNADVMAWVEGELRNRRASDGSLPPHLVMGRYQARSGFAAHEQARPFTTDAPAPDGEPAASTVQALRRVTFTKDYEFMGKMAYPSELAIKRVILQRATILVGMAEHPRDVIQVFDVEGIWEPGLPFSELELGEPLGVLRPVQRYVLKAGVERAKVVNDFLAEELTGDPWGFVRASFGGMSDPVSLTPPILEQIWPEDSDSDDGGQHEFVLCDGNHRVVERVWTEETEGSPHRSMAAVAVVGTPVEPYYARAFSRYEWDVTADNQLVITPPTEFKHAARKVPGSRTDKLLYRRYFRDLETGFGPMGGQGGRFT